MHARTYARTHLHVLAAKHAEVGALALLRAGLVRAAAAAGLQLEVGRAERQVGLDLRRVAGGEVCTREFSNRLSLAHVAAPACGPLMITVYPTSNA